MASHRDQQPGVRRTDTIEDTINTRPATRDEVAYRDGYSRGRAYEQYLRQESRRNTERDGVATGILFGVLLTSVVGLGVILLQIFTQNRDPITAVQPISGAVLEAVPVNAIPTATSVPALPPQIIERTTIIEQDTAPGTAPSPVVPQGTVSPVPNSAQPNTVQPNTVQPNSVQPNTVQPSSVQPSSVQPNVSQPSTGTAPGQGSFNPDAVNEVQPSPNNTGTSTLQTAPGSTTPDTQTAPEGTGTNQGGQN